MSTSEERVRELHPATGIIVTDQGSTKESASGHIETTEEEYVCLRNGEYRRIRIAWTHKYIPPAESYTTILSDERITAAEYARAAQGRQVEDTPRLLSSMKRKDEITQEFKKLIPFCPKCNRSMVYRYSDKTKNHFWGCLGFPNCTGTKPITAAQHQKLTEAKKLGVFF